MNTRFENYVQALTPAKRMIAQEAVREYLLGESQEENIIASPEHAYNAVKYLGAETEEHAVVLLCKQNYRLIKRVEIGHGGLTETVVDVRVILREALLNNATLVFLAHNHPSGSIMPSRIDDDLTRKVKGACNAINIRLVDHLIIGNGTYYSYQNCDKL